MKVYLDYTQEELDRQYEHAHIVPNAEDYSKRSRAESARVRAAATGRFDIAYGDGEDEKLDVYSCGRDGAPIVVHFHGGRWRMGNKETGCESAETYTGAGAHFASIDFSPLPKVSMDGLIRQCRGAVAWLARNAATFGGDAGRIYVTGKSSGGHVAAMVTVTDWSPYGLPADLIKGSLLVSGMYDLEPVRLTFRNEWLKLDEETAARNSPILHIPKSGCPIVIGCGELESDEFRRHPRAFADAWRRAGHECTFIELPGHHHFSLNAEMNNPSSPLVEIVLGWLNADRNDER